WSCRSTAREARPHPTTTCSSRRPRRARRRQAMANPYAATVLVADDDVDALGVVAFGLERMGYRVLRAHDGEEALKLVLERRPDLAILDVMMPKMNGYELVRRIRGTEEVAETPLI